MKQGSVVKLSSKILSPGSKLQRNDTGFVISSAQNDPRDLNFVFWTNTKQFTYHYDVELEVHITSMNEVLLRVCSRLLEILSGRKRT